jgi:hypothetical protein
MTASPRGGLAPAARRERLRHIWVSPPKLRYTSHMTIPFDRLPTGGFAPLVPELIVLDLARSRAFWCDVLGFQVAYQRPEHNFMYRATAIAADAEAAKRKLGNRPS